MSTNYLVQMPRSLACKTNIIFMMIYDSSYLVINVISVKARLMFFVYESTRVHIFSI